jgi:ATP-dependent helicase Lhr and Lhr-like helicase
MEVLSVFDSPPLFTVFYGAEDLGAVHEISFQRKGGQAAVLLLGGRAWRVRFVDYDKHVAFVEPTDDHGRSLWLGSSQPLSFRLCQAMRRLIINDGTNPSWSRRAVSKFSELRQPPLIADPSATVLVETGTSSCIWWTFAGLHGNAALVGILDPTVSTTFDNISLRLSFSTAEFAGALRTARLDEFPAPEMAPPKFSPCLSAPILRYLTHIRELDRNAALATLEFPICKKAKE